MKILSRYVLKEFIANMLLGLAIFTFVLLLEHLFELADLVLNKGVGIWMTLKLLFLLLPSSLMLTFPMSTLLSTLLTFGRLSESSEVTAIRASGLSAWSYVRMPLAAALITSLFLIPFNTAWAPRAHSSFRQLYLQLLKKNPLVRIEEKTFVEIGDYHLFVEKKNKKSKRMKGVSIYKIPASGAPLRIFAQSGMAFLDESRGIIFVLEEGRMEQVDAADPSRWTHTNFKKYQLFIPLMDNQSSSERAMEEMSNKELGKRNNPTEEREFAIPRVGLSGSFALGVGGVSPPFVALGIPLAIRVHRGGRSVGFGLSLLIVVIYYVLVMGGTAVGQRGLAPPWVAVWTGNIILAAVATAFNARFMKQ